jgi:uncharacterized protein YyaL (SSP411 family)
VPRCLTRRGFLRRSAGLTAGVAGLSILAVGAGASMPTAQAAPSTPTPTTSPTPTNTPTPSSPPNKPTTPDGLSAPAPNGRTGPPATSNADRAVAAYNAMQKYFGADHNLYHEYYPNQGSNHYSYHWPYSQSMAATLDMYGLPQVGANYQQDVQNRKTGLAYYWDGAASPPGYDSYVLPPLGQGGDKYYDDNGWDGLAMLQLYRMNGDTSALSRAQQTFAFQVSGWDSSQNDPKPGGVFWVQASWNRDRGTVSNATGAEVGLHLRLLTGASSYFSDAKKMYDWTNQYLHSPDNGLYWDKVLGFTNGAIDETQWSYNQGTMIGSSVLLYRVTNDSTYLSQARSVASAALSYYGGSGSSYYSQGAAFNAIFFRNLLQLSAVDTANNAATYRQAMQSYADKVWNDASIRDPKTNLFKPLETSSSAYRLLDQAAMVQVYAALAWDSSNYGKLA